MSYRKTSLEKIRKIYHLPLFELLSKSHKIHQRHFQIGEIQICSLISYKTGGCPENCKYCPQSSHYQTNINAEKLLSYEELIRLGKKAKERGATRVCIGAAWRTPREGKAFDTLLKAIKEIATFGVEVCVTLGMLTKSQAKILKESGLTAYNHNLDTSSAFYKNIVTTRTYQERLDTLDEVQKVGLSLCTGAILGMGESVDDRIALIHTLASRKEPPESIPLNFLISVKGTPLEHQKPIPIWEMLRMIATIRIIMPPVMIRLSAGRLERSLEEQMLCFMAGANAIFSGEKLLTMPNIDFDEDEKMFSLFGLTKMKAFQYVSR